MNKHRRHELKMLKYVKRLKQLRLTNMEGNFNPFRSHGKPCSCWVCRNDKYRNTKRKENKRLNEL